jgi:hypothetical protein
LPCDAALMLSIPGIGVGNRGSSSNRGHAAHSGA